MPPRFLWMRGKFLSAEAIPLVALCWLCSLGFYLNLWCGLFTTKVILGKCTIFLFSSLLFNFIVFNSLVSCTLFCEIICSKPNGDFFVFIKCFCQSCSEDIKLPGCVISALRGNQSAPALGRGRVGGKLETSPSVWAINGRNVLVRAWVRVEVKVP